MATLSVGVGQQFSTISAAVAASHDGDVVQVQAGTYNNDFAEIKTKITLEGVGGMVHMTATGDIPNDKGILVTDTDVTIDHFEFSGAQGASGNDAGIRYQGGALTLTNDYFHDNQNGVMGGAAAGGTITIRNSEFSHNGAGDGYTHNLYVGDIAKLTIDNSYFHDAVVGHEIKSRAEETVITNSRIFDNAGSASYSIDVPNGGKTTISGNVIEQGPNSENPNIIAYGEEGGLHAGSTISVTNNTVLNDLGKGALLWDASNSTATVSGNSVWNIADSQVVSGSGATVSATTHLTGEPALDTSHPYAAAGATPTPPAATDGDDQLQASASLTEIHGAAGNDTIIGWSGADYLRGDDGADSIAGGSAFDDINGNMGADTAHGGAGDDWVLGGKDNDVLFGDDGADFMNGNIGADTVDGGAGADTVLGGQSDDVLSGGDGNDWISGDRGADTMTGGAGADTFHAFGGMGVDVVTDFSLAQGDHIQVDAGVSYSVSQSGANAVIDFGAGDQLILTNVNAASLTPGWILTV